MIEAVVLAAGKGTRMRSDLIKVLHPIQGLPVLGHVLKTLALLGVKKPRVVVGSQADQVRAFLTQADKLFDQSSLSVLQAEQKGTGHAVLMTVPSLKKSRGDVLIWPGDMPLVKPATLKRFLSEHARSGSAVSVLSCLAVNPYGYGRILRAGGKFIGIREELDASESERTIQEVNTGIYVFQAPLLFGALKKLKPSNRKAELYLTDTIEILAREGHDVHAFPFAEPQEGQGINSREDLAKAIQVMNQREVQRHMMQGVTFEAPGQTFVAAGVKIGQDTVVYPWCYIESGVTIGKGCQIGPFAKIRSGSVIGDGSVVGSFVEINRTKFGKAVLAKHLAYLGDAVVGDGSNIGAGTITANYDGKNKHVTRIGKKAFIGSNTVLIAPVQIGDQAKTGAGAVVTAGTHVRRGEVALGVPARTIRKNKLRAKGR